MKTRDWRFLALCTILAAGSPGCSGDDEPYVTLVPVEGSVTENGKPFEGAMITFVPEPTNRDQTTGVDRTGEDGAFRAKYRNRPGLAPGKYKVVVSKTRSTPGKEVPEAFQNFSYMSKRGGLFHEETPKAYNDPKKTPLSLEVSDKGEKGLVFDLKKSSRPLAKNEQVNSPAALAPH